MVLHIDLYEAYLVMPNVRSRIAGYYHLGHQPNNTKSPTLNGQILIVCKKIQNVVASAAESEIGGLFHNIQPSIPIRFLLNAL